MTDVRHVAVIDIGKTNAKVALVDLDTSSEVASRRQPNRPRMDGPYPHHDVEALWAFILDGLAGLGREHPVDAISVTTHGATAALVDAGGDLALPALDYEFDGPDRLRGAYEAVRPPFSETGTPALPAGLNLGAQLFWLQKTFPEAFAKARVILPYPQFWAAKLTGVVASEVTSLGCHTDLWNPGARDFSSLVERMGWRELFPPPRKASDELGPLLPAIAVRTGLDPATPVLCGIHDSNASLLPHLLARKPPFAVVSTGTWVVAMAIGAASTPLDPARDTLINVNAFGDLVPSARFMGGREFELLMEGHSEQPSDDDLAAVLDGHTMLLPSAIAGSGPFPGRHAQWVGAEPHGGARHAAVSLYLALMTTTCLDLIGAEGIVVVEGPFSGNKPYLTMLEAAGQRPVVTGERESTGTSMGAALLARKARSVIASSDREDVGVGLETFRRYAAAWRSAVAAR
ncbi:FGGY-family carbohydrate kinase [Mesorhizobium sp. KR9-304]|uniref:FGGY-family carbohydrate kinase n=1 Tax=Mesorhizobium sp. KR9-304 TaxID=3156614 RepID=UPI0032B5C6BD